VLRSSRDDDAGVGDDSAVLGLSRDDAVLLLHRNEFGRSTIRVDETRPEELRLRAICRERVLDADRQWVAVAQEDDDVDGFAERVQRLERRL
jgi:hypothetical protein